MATTKIIFLTRCETSTCSQFLDGTGSLNYLAIARLPVVFIANQENTSCTLRLSQVAALFCDRQILQPYLVGSLAGPQQR